MPEVKEFEKGKVGRKIGRTRSPGRPEDPGGWVHFDVAGTCNNRFGLIIPVPLAPNHICG
jgi:hypothetical protein